MTIVTPEGVTMEVTLAGVGSRLLAATIDGLIQFAIAIAVGIAAFGAFQIGDNLEGGEADSGEILMFIAIANVVLFLIFFFYYVFFELVWSGRSPGKRGAGLRVVLAGGQPIDFRSSAIRNILRIVDLLPTMYAVGITAILASSNNQRVGDMVAGTVVIREPRTPKAGTTARPDLYTLKVRPELSQELAGWDVSGITAEEIATVRRFLDRRETIQMEPRARIAADIESKLRPRVPGVPDAVHTEQFLELLSLAKASRG